MITRLIPAQSIPLVFSSFGHFLMHATVALYLTAMLFIESLWNMNFVDLIDLWWWGSLMIGLGAPLAGWLGDRYGRAQMMVVFFVLTGMSLGMVGLAQTPFSLRIGLICLGVAAAIYHPVGIPWIADQNAARRGRALGIVGVFGAVGIALASTVASGIEAFTHWRAIFLIPAVISLAGGLTLAMLLRATQRRTTPKDSVATTTPPFGAARRVLLHVFVGFFLVMALNAIIWHTVNMAMPKWFALTLPASSLLQVGMMVTLVYALAGVSQYVGGSLSDRFPPHWVYMTALCLHIPFLLWSGFASGAPLIMILALQVFFLTAALPAESLLILRITPRRWLGTIYGFKFIAAFGVQPLALMTITYSQQHPVTSVFVGSSPFATMLPVLAGLGAVAFIGAFVLFATRVGTQRLPA